jgi:hypothetical protein
MACANSNVLNVSGKKLKLSLSLMLAMYLAQF